MCRKNAVLNVLVIIFWSSAVMTLVAVFLTSAGHGNDALNLSMMVGALLVLILGMVISVRGKLLNHIVKNW